MQTQRSVLVEPRLEAKGQAVSYGQRALWYLARLAPESSAYNLAAAGRVRGDLDVEALRRALRRLVERHASLRTTFAEEAGEPVQRIAAEPRFGFQLVDAAGCSEEELQRRLEAEAYRPFDLERGPLLRVGVFRRAAGEHLLVVAVHHAVADFWSIGLIIRELSSLYRPGLLEMPEMGGPLDDEKQGATYADLVAGQRALVESPEGAADAAYWQAKLAGLPDLDLPSDRPRPPVQSFRGDVAQLEISGPAVAALRKLARAHRATPFTVGMAAFQALLGRWTGQRDFAVGSPVGNRAGAELATVIGYFVNPLVVRADLAGDPSFDELVVRVRATLAAAFDHQRYPFPLLAERLAAGRDASRSPLFQAMFVWLKARWAGEDGIARYVLSAPGGQASLGTSLTLDSHPLRHAGSQFDLTLAIAEERDGLLASLQYNTDLFDRATAERLLGHFQALLESALASPGVRLSALSMLTAEEERQLLVEWSGQEAAPSDELLHGLVARQAAATPGATAVTAGGAALTYAELDLRSSLLARRLAALGVGPEVRVGIFLERRLPLPVAMLAVLKAGGAYVPLDPDYPAERLALLCEDSRLSVLISERKLAGRVPGGGFDVVWADAQDESEAPSRETASGEAAATPRPRVDPDNLAYLIYTSGSTGRPKSVALTHRGAVAMVRWGLAAFSREELAGTLASTSICFDLSVFELFVPLAAGGMVILADNALALPALPAASRVTLVNTVPSAAAELLRSDGFPRSVATINLAGEPLARGLVDELYATTAARAVYNLYGPSEETTYSTGEVVPRGDGPVLIGRPLAGTRAFVLDRGRRPVPVGVAGELLLGGVGLARGYLGRPGLTAEKFVPNPLALPDGALPEAVEPGGRLYRTGDLVRFRPDGRLEFLGRIDHQVKVRGFRIELGEVEAALRQHAGVRDCVVVARQEHGKGLNAFLAAYVVPQGEGWAGHSEPGVTELRTFLGKSLPAYMVPSAFVFLDALPLTPNGKVDRRALPAPELAAAHEAYQPPANAIEEMVAEIWTELLGVTRIGRHDDFFALGGHSLLATRVLSRVRDSFGVELAVRSLVESPTVAGLAAAIEESLLGEVGEEALARALADLA